MGWGSGNLVGGGSELAFRVLAGLEQPASPRENDIWVNTNTEVTSWDFSTTEPCRRSANRNLLTYPYYHTTMTDNGIKFTDNGDGTVKVNGTATAQARFRPFHNKVAYGMIWLDPGTYTASGCPKGGSRTTYFWEVYDNDATKALAYDIGDGATFTLTHGTHVRGSFIVNSGNKLTNAVFKPQIEKGSSPTSFVKGDATGQVWFPTGTSSPVSFNAVKKNSLMVYPLSAKQYIGGTWVEKTAKSYQGGAWVEWWSGQLYENGNTYASFTGGYSIYGDGTTLTENADHLYIESQGPSGVYNNNPVDMTDYGTLTFDWTCVRGGIDIRFQVRTDKSTGGSGWAAGTTIVGPDATRQTTTLDISGLSGSYYVGIGRFSSGGPAQVKIHSIIMS